MRKKADKNKMSTFSKNLRALRTRAILTQEELAEEAGVSIDSIKFWETGRRYPSLKFLVKLESALKCTIEDLTSESGPRSLADDLYVKIKSAVEAAVKSDALSADEKELLRLIRLASPERVHAIRYILQEQPQVLSQKKKSSK